MLKSRPISDSLRYAHLSLIASCFALAIACPAWATPPVVTAPPPDTSGTQNGPDQTPNATRFQLGLMRRSNLLADAWGIRPWLSKYGISLSLIETSELLGNLTGGAKRGFDYDGLTQLDLQLDTQRAFGHYGGLFNVSALQIHGNNLSANNLYSLQTASGIEADRSTRLWELWYQQKFLAEDRLDVKIGQQSLDQEFMVSSNAGLFVNTMFGWAMVPSADLPGGGPAYPLSALGVRARARPTDAITILAGVFNGSPTSNNIGDPQRNDNEGTTFPTNGGTLAIAEAQFAYPALGSMVYAGSSAPLPRVYRLGAYYDSERFDDERRDDSGLSLADPNSTGTPRSHRGNYGVYGVVDRMLWISPDDADRTLSFFGRAMAQPQEDRNLVDFSLNAGMVLRDPIPHIDRDDDSFGIGLGFANISSGASGLDRDTNTFNSSAIPVRSNETFVEVTYQYQYTPWCQIQPDIQYVINPGGGLDNPDSPGSRIHDELVIGTRVNILF